MSFDSQKTLQQIGFIGLGAMGLPMAINLVNADFSVCGYDITTEAVEAFQAAGGKGAASASEAGSNADLLIVMVATSDQADAALYGAGGAVASLPSGTTIVLCSTVSPDYVRSLEKRLAESRHLLLDAPVSGGTGGAEGATLTVMASGSQAAYRTAEAALQATASRVYNLGKKPGISVSDK